MVFGASWFNDFPSDWSSTTEHGVNTICLSGVEERIIGNRQKDSCVEAGAHKLLQKRYVFAKAKHLLRYLAVSWVFQFDDS